MADKTKSLKQSPSKQPAPAATKRDAAKQQKTLTMRHLWRMTLWGMTAAGTLLLAVLSTRSEVGSERIAAAFPSLHGHSQVAQAFDAQAETRRLAAAVNDLTAQNAELKSRLASVERNVDDVTGSVTRQIEAAKAETAPPWPTDAAPEPVTPATVATIVNPTVPPPAGFAAPLPLPPSVMPAAASPEATPPAAGAREYAVDVGSALSVEALRARWLGLHSAHLQLFAGLTPTVARRDIPQTNRSELRLVVGPLPSSAAAAQLCAALAPYRLFCRPTLFDRQHVVLQ